MCISDWSSDVCSSDLDEVQACAVGAEPGVGLDARGRGDRGRRGRRPGSGQAAAPHQLPSGEVAVAANEPEVRSEEHTSELQSLMRISYAVFCLKKQQNKQPL